MRRIIIYLMLPLTIFANEYSRLLTDLFKNYVKEIRPVCGGQPVVVYIDVALRQIQGMDEQRQIISTNVWMRFTWNDCNLSWNVSQYNGIANIGIPEKKIWLPDIALYENAEYKLRGINEFYPVQINSSGFVHYNIPSQPHTSCSLNIRYFPFDVQICKLTFGSWSYNDFGVKVMSKSNKGDRSNYLTNGEWELIDYYITKNTKNYTCCKGPYTTIIFEIKIRRKPSVYLLNLIFPSILVSAISLLSFFIPCESGEKVSISVTVLLSLAVFHLVISETLPPNSDSLPYLGYFFLANMLFVGFCCSMSIIVLNIYHSKTGDSCIIRAIRYLQTKRMSLKIMDKTNYSVTPASTKRKTATETQPNGEYVQNQGQKMKCMQRPDLGVNKETLPNDFFQEMGKSFAEKRQAEELKAELASVEIYINRFFLIIAIILYISLMLMLLKIS